MMYGRKKPRGIASLVLIGLFLWLLNPYLARAQDPASVDPCDSFVQTAEALLWSADSTDPEVLQAIATTAEQGRLCYGEKSKARVVWLLNRETWALDQLGRYEEAEVLVDLFYEQYVEAASEEDRARFAMYRFRFRTLEGDLIRAAIAFQEALQFRSALPLERQAHLLINGAYLHRQTQSLSQALQIARQAETLTAEDSTLRLVHARALLVKSEVILSIEQEKTIPDSLVLASIIEELEKAHSIFQAQRIWVRSLATTITVGQVYAALGDIDQAHTHFEQALAQAHARGDSRTLIVGHLRRGRVYLDQGTFREAEDDFNAGLALTDTSGVREFELDLLLGLAEAREAQHDLAEARRLYRRVIDADLSEVSVAEVVQAKDRARSALLRVMMTVEKRAIPMAWFWAVLVLSLALVAYLVYTRHRRDTRATIDLRNLLDPKGLLKLDGDSKLLQQRLDYIAHVLDDPEAILSELDEPVFRREVARQGIVNNTMLFNCIAALEEKASGKIFDNDPANTLSRYLRQEFRVRHIPWPQTPDAWRWMIDGSG